MRLIAGLLLAATLALLLMRHENAALKASFTRANQVAYQQKQDIARLQAERRALDNQLQQNDRAGRAWRQKLIAASEASVRQEQTIARLLNENKAFRDWYSSDLPDAVRRVHQRPACASASHCLQPLPATGAVPDASEQPTH